MIIEKISNENASLESDLKEKSEKKIQEIEN